MYEEKTVIDAKTFGKACGAQVCCDITAKYVVTPAVKSFVGDNDSLTAKGLSLVGNYLLSSVIIGQVNKI